ncbi:GNAT family N-acetyltransferase [Photobacterium sp. DNB23_23_1]|uniref:GNAT family N-acetyltransferase n=1 Tax=Photobacterium pectinilyticum TaxID=2906793 RepID=A0ABT1N0J8_9GAMM|nr:GNAT family N-acetyltransferase [Photobacterium sp. ZSDE20]MCQ1058067.1 GNAT family N-acetyltransferase [Photobacterium sp. ZSDE20]MDD1822600.1 GNAT family N-acetyltransferase [Photobacterium sp. ZSDE20]
MQHQPLLTTQRLLLRPLQLSDAKRVQELAGDEQIANGTINIPHPYTDGVAGQWIGRHLAGWHQGQSAIYAITLKPTQQLIGCVGLHNIQDGKAQLGYWIGVPYWGLGYCTEAADRIVEFGFKRLNLETIYGQHFSRENNSGKVMQKIGMKHVMTRNHGIRVNMITENMEYYEMKCPQALSVS